jgi:hypothetical protein
VFEEWMKSIGLENRKRRMHGEIVGNLVDAASRQPLKTDKLKKALLEFHRDGSTSCQIHGAYTIIGQIPYERCQVCSQEETNKSGAEWAFQQIANLKEEIATLRAALTAIRDNCWSGYAHDRAVAVLDVIDTSAADDRAKEERGY